MPPGIIAVGAPRRIDHRERGVPDRTSPDPAEVAHPFREADYTQVLMGCIGMAIDSERRDIQAKALAHFNAKFGRHGLPPVPQSHQWAKLADRLWFIRYYVEALYRFDDGPAPTRHQLTLAMADMEVDWERTHGAHYAAYQEMTARWYGPRFRAPDPPPTAPPPKLDPETQEIIDRNQVSKKLQAYLGSLSKGRATAEKAYGELLVAQANVLSELGVRLRMEFDDQKQRADDHPVIEWLVAHDFPIQNGQLFPVLFDLLNQVRAYAKAGANDIALRQLESAETLHDRLATLLAEYYADKVAYARRMLVLLHTLKSISRMMVSFVVFRDIKGIMSQFAALVAVNVAFQQLDRSIGQRKELSGKDAVVDAAMELLMVKVTGKVTELLATRFAIDPRSITGHSMNMLVGGVVGSLQEELMNLGRGVSFVSFLRRLRDRLTDPGFWIENIAVSYLGSKYKSRGSVSLPFGRKTAGAVVLASAFLVAPKPASASPARTPMVEVTPHAAVPKGSPSSATRSRPADARTTRTSAGPNRTTLNVEPATVDRPGGAPSESQRRVDRSSLSPRQRSPSSPVAPASGTPAIAGAALTRRHRKQAALRRRITEITKLLDKIADHVVRNEAAAQLKALRKELVTSKDLDALADRLQAVQNRVNETYAVEQITFFVEYTPESFDVRKVHKRVVVPTRGKKGPEILDIVFEVTTTSGKRAFLVIEAKYGTSRLGWVKLGKKLLVRQFSPEWFDMRIKEIRIQDPAFASQLEKAWKSGHILPFVLKIVEDGTPSRFVDFKQKWTEYRDKRG